jgi:hypothetical protein
MYRKLVKLDPNNGKRFSEVDLICVRRAAAALKDYIERCIDPDDDPYGIRKQVLPLCEGALNGSLKMPLSVANDIPLEYPSREGWLPKSFKHHWSNFWVPATGSPLERIEYIHKDGELYGYMYFEEPGDWPEVVEQYRCAGEARWFQESKYTPEKIREIQRRQLDRQAMLAADEKQLEEKWGRKREAGK